MLTAHILLAAAAWRRGNPQGLSRRQIATFSQVMTQGSLHQSCERWRRGLILLIHGQRLLDIIRKGDRCAFHNYSLSPYSVVECEGNMNIQVECYLPLGFSRQ